MSHGRFWDTLSRQLENKGPEYVARCTLMEEPGGTAILPASFPQLPVQEIQEITPLVNVCEEDLKNVSEINLLNSYAVASANTSSI